MLTGSSNPYDILGIDRDADKKTIKRAYAELVKQYHPEEYPEEWKRIHNAYEQAMELVSAKKQNVSVSAPQESPEQEWDLTDAVKFSEQKEAPNTSTGIPEQKEAPHTPTGIPEQKQVPNAPVGTPLPKIRQEAPETEAEDIFGDVEKIAGKQREQEESAAKEKLESAMHKMRQLIWDNKFRKKEWKKFFEQEDMLPIVSQKQFLQELGDCFDLKQIGPNLYSYLNEKLEAIDEYIKEYNTDLSRSRDLAAVKYAKSKVRLAHERYAKMREEQGKAFLEKWAVPIVLVVLFIVGMVYVSNEEQRRREEQQRWKQIMEMPDMSEIDRSGTEEETTEESMDVDTKQ